MTFNPTTLNLARAIKDGRLAVREPIRPRGEGLRYLLVTPYVADLLDGKHTHLMFPDAEAESVIGRYAAGMLVTVSRIKTKQAPDLERLEGSDEVWALCARKPSPGWRLLGRFHSKNIFIGLRPYDKHYLFPRYPAAMQETIEHWKEILGSEPAHAGETVGDYISPKFRDLDEEII